jgi:hypothetical protein
MLLCRFLVPFAAVSVFTQNLGAEKLTDEQRIEMLRGLTAEYATVKTFLPRSKKALEYRSTGEYDKAAWQEAGNKLGPAARVGDLIQITKVNIEDDKIVFQINGGYSGGRKWYQNVEVGMGNSTRPINSGQTNAPGGTTLALVFDNKTPALPAAEIKKLLAPILDFERRSATEQAVEMLPPEIKQAVKENRAIEGMNRDQVLMALGKPRTKVRETKDGVDEEDWIYGLPPGKVTFVTFANSKVIRVKENYAGLGGSTTPPMKPPL